MGFGFGLMEAIFPIMFITIFVIVIGGFIFTAVRGVSTWSKNNSSPVLTVEASIVSKRTNVSHHHNNNNTMHSSSSTSYYVTFQVESGDRIELQVDGSEYGMLVEGDKGKLTFQGTRYKEFLRN